MQNLVYNDDGLVEKISCSRLFSDSTQGKETVELTEEEKKHFCWLVLMLDTEPIDRVEGDSRPPIRIKKK